MRVIFAIQKQYVQILLRVNNGSGLTSTESHRFRRAMYRIMFYCNMFPYFRWNDVDARELSTKNVELIRRHRIAVLDSYPLNEVFELYAGVRFMRLIMEPKTQVLLDGALRCP